MYDMSVVASERNCLLDGVSQSFLGVCIGLVEMEAPSEEFRVLFLFFEFFACASPT
jgi:hypothetical protein